MEEISMRHCGYHRRKKIFQGLLSIKIALSSGIPESSSVAGMNPREVLHALFLLLAFPQSSPAAM